MGFVNKTYLQLSLDLEEKEYIKVKAKELGYKSISAFLVDSAKNHFRIELDISAYREVAKEINYIGKNINNLVRKINTEGFYTDTDLDFIKTNQNKIINLMNKEYDKILNLKKKFVSGNLSLDDKKRLIKELVRNGIKVPKKMLLEEIYERIKDDVVYLCEVISKSPVHDQSIVDYVFEYFYSDSFFSLEEKELIQFADELFLFTQKIKFKLIKLDNYFDDEDWYSFKELLDKYEK